MPEGVAGLRVLGFCDHLPFGSSGGSERVAWELYRRLAAGGAEITLLAARPGRSGSTETIEGVRIVSVPSVRLARVLKAEVSLAPQMFRRALHEATEVAPDVLHANSLHFQSSIAAALVQRSRSLPLVTTVHLAAVDRLPAALRAATTAYERSAGRFILRRSDRVIAVSASVAAHVRSLGMPGDRIVTVPNGVDHDAFAPDRQNRHDVPHLVMVGRLIVNKGPELFVDALAQLRDGGVAFTAALIGEGPMRDVLMRKAGSLRLTDRLEFPGHVTDVARELRRADILVRPSLTEGMPLSVLEAMASGVCVVASEVPGTTDLVEDGVSGVLFTPGSLSGLTAALERVLSDSDVRENLAAAGHATSLAHSWDASAAAGAAVLVDAARRASLSAS